MDAWEELLEDEVCQSLDTSLDARDALFLAMNLFDKFDNKEAERVIELEELVDHAGAVSLAAGGEDGTVLGYASAQTVLDEGYINNVAVHPACRRQGIASRLLEELRRQGLITVRPGRCGAQITERGIALLGYS